MKVADTRQFRTKDGKEFHSFLVVEATFLEKPGLLAVVEVVEREGDPPLELFLHAKTGFDLFLEQHKDDWVELTERKVTLAQEVLDSLRQSQPPTHHGRSLLDSAATELRSEGSPWRSPNSPPPRLTS